MGMKDFHESKRTNSSQVMPQSVWRRIVRGHFFRQNLAGNLFGSKSLLDPHQRWEVFAAS
jgi:hypothetical protein